MESSHYTRSALPPSQLALCAWCMNTFVQCTLRVCYGLWTRLDLLWNQVSKLSFLLFAFQNQWQLGVLLLGEGKLLLWATMPIVRSCVIMLVNLKGRAEIPMWTLFTIDWCMWVWSPRGEGAKISMWPSMGKPGIWDPRAFSTSGQKLSKSSFCHIHVKEPFY